MRETDQIAVAKKNRCKVRRGEPGCHDAVKRRMALIDLEEKINNCEAKLSFISEFFGQETSGKLEISESAISGLCLFLQDIDEDLDRSSDLIEMIAHRKKEKNPKKPRRRIEARGRV